jgi:rfaE bifunctional protein nucleotidyltransferase chain/domain
VTLGAEGALVCGPGAQAVALPASAAHGGDPCGAGDRFASALAVLLGAGVAAHDAVGTAVAAASDFVAAGGAGRAPVGRRGAGGGGLRDAGLMAAAGARLPAHGRADAAERVARVRAGGGTVVATGGCFDLLHAGHVSVLAAARALGDCLIVLLNSDASVRRLKGADRPLVGQHDRAGVLAALDAVDAVVIFDEDTPMPALSRLRPDVWAKGGDYRVEDLPEAELLERWGGRTVILPFVAGRSTTRLIEEAALRVA